LRRHPTPHDHDIASQAQFYSTSQIVFLDRKCFTSQISQAILNGTQLAMDHTSFVFFIEKSEKPLYCLMLELLIVFDFKKEQGDLEPYGVSHTKQCFVKCIDISLFYHNYA
jgi:hypothetical protein